MTWIEGALDRPDSLERLVEGADAVIHVAGVINAPDPAGFEAGNVSGTSAVLAQRHVEGAPGEVPGLAPLLANLDLAGAVVTADALHTHADAAEFLVTGK